MQIVKDTYMFINTKTKTQTWNETIETNETKRADRNLWWKKGPKPKQKPS